VIIYVNIINLTKINLEKFSNNGKKIKNPIIFGYISCQNRRKALG
jgi:hypothetical protein